MAEPRPSTDQETAPLLRRDDEHNGTADHDNQPTFTERFHAAIQEPVSDLTKVLLVLCLILLIISSVFVGLFAGAQHKLNHRKDAPSPPTFTTLTATTTASGRVSTTTGGTFTTTATTTTTRTTTQPIAVPTSPPADPACFTPDCIILSASILSSLDTSQDPCENFYQFANGGWLADHPLPADKGSFGRFHELARQNQQLVQGILEKDYTITEPENPDAEIIHKLHDLYSSCLAEDTLDSIGNEPVKKLVRTAKRLFYGETTDITGLEDDEKTGKKKEKLKHGLTAAIAFLHSRGIGSLFSFDVEGDGLQPNLMSLWFSQPELGLPSKEYYLEAEITDLYQSVIEELLVLLDDDEDVEKDVEQVSGVSAQTPLAPESASNIWPPWPWPPWGGEGSDGDKKPENKTEKAKSLAKKIVKLESAIANATADLDVLQEDPVKAYNPLPLSNLTETLSEIDFVNYFATFAPRNFPTTVIQDYPPYASSLSKILSSTSPSTLFAYLSILTTLQTAPYLGPTTSIYLAHRRLVETLTGVKKGSRGDRGEECVTRVESALGFASGRLFVVGLEERKKGVGKAITELSRDVMSSIISAFKDSLKTVSWMDKKSAKAAGEKADALRIKVGYPLSPDTRDPRSIARYYSLVKISERDYFGNMISAARSDEVKKWAKLGRARDLEEWEMQPATVNAYYNPPGNEIVFPIGILQPPFFAVDWPGYLNYGAFGMVAAHELTHAFDGAGRKYNQEGKLEEWWSNTTSAGFQLKKDCIVEQYAKYSIDDGKGGKVYINGNLTSGENIGDTGLIQAYRAWKAQYPDALKKGSEYMLPGLNYTRDQLFFISFARVWAMSMKPASAVQRVRTDPHSPSIFRVEGTVSNIPEFAKAFNCSSKAKLNPPREKQCIFWS